MGPNSIRAWRKRRGLTLEQLAAQVDSTPATLSRIERQVRPYSQHLLERLADALVCEPEDLVSRRAASEEQLEIIALVRAMDEPKRREMALKVLKALVL